VKLFLVIACNPAKFVLLFSLVLEVVLVAAIIPPCLPLGWLFERDLG
jgi:hypothetical protein